MQKCQLDQNVTCHILTRKELAKLTGYSERTISRRAGEIPGATLRPIGRWDYGDRDNADVQAWIQRARTANDSKRQGQRIKAKRTRSKAAPSMIADLQAIQECAAAFNICSPFLHKIHPHQRGTDFDETLGFDEWVLFGKLLKSLCDLPPVDRIELLIGYFHGSKLPAAFKGLFELGQWFGGAFPRT